MSSYASGVVFAKNHPLGKNLCGIGTAPEGIGTIPVVYDHGIRHGLERR